VATLEQCWRELSAATPRQKFCINLCGVSFIDNAGKVLLKEMYRLGAELLAEGCLNQAVVTEIIKPGRKSEARGTKDPKDNDPSKGSPFIFYVIFFSLLLVPKFAGAQTKNSTLPSNAPTDASPFSPVALPPYVLLSRKVPLRPPTQVPATSIMPSNSRTIPSMA